MDLPAGIEAAATKLSEVVATYGPKAAELTLALGKIAALKDLVSAGVGLAAGAAILMFVTRPLLKMGIAEIKSPTGYKWSSGDRSTDDAKLIPAIMGSIFSGFTGGAFVGVNAFALINPILWVGLSRPELYLAAKALNL